MANIYVRKSGNDSNNGSTPALAKLTIAGAISAASSGDEIIVGAGVYREKNLSTGNKNISIFGDTTGELTGDAGDFIWSGLDSSDDGYTEADYAITSPADYNLELENILFENWRLKKDTYLILKNTNGNLSIENVNIFNVYIRAHPVSALSGGIINYDHTGSSPNLTIKNLNIDKVKCFYSSDVSGAYNYFYGIRIKTTNATGNTVLENIKIDGVMLVGSDGSRSNYDHIFCIYLYVANTPSIKNIEISDVFIWSEQTMYIYGIYLENKAYSIYNCIVHDLFASTYRSDYSRAEFYNFYSVSASNAYNCSAFNSSFAYRSASEEIVGAQYTNITENNCKNIGNYRVPKIDLLSIFSPLRGFGSSTQPTSDILGNPIPAYGAGDGDIGALASTSPIIQKESTIKDSGDYSIKVSPCSYFKKTFQIPVTASELKTVKVKIRIDGTWGSYRPRVSLSGQGMTLSQATKNSTTGAFEELTVSGTPTTNGIALLTIEAHSANADAVFYIDTITIE